MAARDQTHDTVVVGCGQAGLAMSCLLTEAGVGHVVLDKGDRVGDSWRRRWDSFTLVTPNWFLRLPGHPYRGDDPDGHLTRDDVVSYLEEYAASFDPPVRFGVTVTAVRELTEGGYAVDTTAGSYQAANVVVAAGTFQHPRLPQFASRLPADITQLHTSEYRNPERLGEGAVLVVGSGQSGGQIAEELLESGRDVYLSVGRTRRLPRRYRTRDGIWWAVQLGVTDQTVDDLDSPSERFEANPLISGKNGGRDLDLHRLTRDGMVLLGRLLDIEGKTAVVAGDLHDRLTAVDTQLAEFRRAVDRYVEEAGMEVPTEPLDEPRDGFAQEIIRRLDLDEAGIGTVIWATGYRWDFGWIQVPVFDAYGYPIQIRGVTSHPGLYFVGLHWLHTLKSGLFAGVGADAEHITRHLTMKRVS